jgi:protein disulfide-isomerase
MKAFLCKLAASGLALALVSSTVLAAAGWSDDYEKGLAQAKAEKKLLVLDFTGSDWCGWCMKLDKEVFKKPEFKDYAKQSLILVQLDFPHQKPQSKKVKEQNATLAKKFEIKGYPTIILLSSEGELVGQTGYQPGGAEKYVEHLKSLLAKSKGDAAPATEAKKAEKKPAKKP